MKLDVQTIKRLSPLLDEALDLEISKQEAWFASLKEEEGDLVPVLRELLARHAAVETNAILINGPQFTAPGAPEHKSNHEVGAFLGPYRLVKEIAHGGMGEVWLAERADGVLRRTVALKLPILHVRRNILVQRFERERNILASLTHPHIARLYDAGISEDGQPYLAMEYVDGFPIDQYCEQTKLSIRARIVLLLQVMAAVQYAHTNLVIHRDLKPSNVLVTSEGKALLLDFGIAKLLDEEASEVAETALTQIGGRALTLQYAAPEQVSGAPVSTATDVYALGVLLYEILTRRRPFVGSKREIEHAILTEEPDRPGGVPIDLVTVLLKALKKSPLERYSSVSSFAVDLENWLEGKPVSAQPDSATYRLQKFIGRHRIGVASAAAVTVTLVAATIISFWQASIARRETQTAAAVERFLLGIFSANSSLQPDPEKARRTSARELLDLGAQRISNELQDAPQAKLRVLGTLAKMYDDLTLAEPALALYRQQLALLRQVESSDSVKLALVLAEVGSRAARANAMEESNKAFDEARAIFAARGDETSFERGKLELRVADVMQDQRNLQGLAPAKKAVAILRNYSPSVELLSAMFYQSSVGSDVGELQASLALVREALEIAPQVPNVTAHQMVELHLELARLLNQDYQIEAAESSMRQAYDLALSKEGTGSHLTLNAALELGNQFYNNGEYEKALRAFTPAATAAEQALAKGDRTWLQLLLVAYRGATLMKMGDVEKGLLVLNDAQRARDILDANPPIDTFLRILVAEALAIEGLRAATDAELEAVAKVLHSTPLEENERETGELTYARLRCAVIRGDGVASRQSVVGARLDVVPANEVPNATLRRLVRLAEAQLVMGDLTSALLSAVQMIQTLPRSSAPSYDADRERRANLVVGKVHTLQGHPDLALPFLQRAVALAEGRLSTKTSPHHADAMIWLGQAQLATGRAQEAKQLAMHAQEIHARHPQLEEAFRKPLAALKARLKALPQS